MNSFVKLWSGQTLSAVGTAVTIFALPSLAILSIRATPFQVGVLSAFEVLPMTMLALIAGVLADRLSRRRMMILADVGRLVALSSIPIAFYFHMQSLLHLYVVALAIGTFAAFFDVAYLAFLPLIVPRTQLPSANAKLQMSASGADIVGRTVAGILVQSVGAARAIGLDAVSYLASLVTLMWINVAEPVREHTNVSLRSVVKDIVSVVRLRLPGLYAVGAVAAVVNGGLAIAGAIELLYAYRVLHVQPATVGAVYGVASLGLLGTTIAPRVIGLVGLRGALALGVTLVASGTAVLSVAPAATWYTPLFLFGNGVLASAGLGIVNVAAVSFRQMLVDESLQGRVNALFRTIAFPALPLGYVLGGTLGTVLSLRTTLVIAVLVQVTALLLISSARLFRIGVPKLTSSAA
jgi:hypothetical protein